MRLPRVDGTAVSPAHLAASELFSKVSGAILDESAGRASLVDFPRGALMARQGDKPDGFYVITRGSAEVVVEAPDATEELVDIVSPGDCVGDLALLLDQPRTATVRAIRDCQAAHFSIADFAWLLSAAPQFAVGLAHTIGDRLRRTTRGRLPARDIVEVAAVALSVDAATEAFVTLLSAALSRLPGPTVSLASMTAAPADLASEAFREADAIVLVADGAAKPDIEAAGRLLDLLAEIKPRPRISLVLLHAAGPPFTGTLPWLRDRRLRSWHHARTGDAGDAARIARRVAGRAVGLVLSGGGARGFAHIGVLRAFEQAQIPIDMIGGTSMGAIVAAQYAAGLGVEQMIDLMRRAYLRTAGFPDFAVPIVAIFSGRGTERRLKSMFGDRRIENLPLPYFAVSADLRTAETVVHETGRVWRATRCSCSVPGMLPPVHWRGRLLVDGGLLDNLPVDALRQRCHGRVVASDVSVAVEFDMTAAAAKRRRWPFRPRGRLPDIAHILMRTAQLGSVRDSREAGIPADLYLNPELHDVGMSDFDRLDEIVERGAAFARAQLAEWTP